MTKCELTMLVLAAGLLASTPAATLEVAPGWHATGEWQCGPVRVISSTDGQGGVDFYVQGAWFDNHYTLQRGMLYYNGVPCLQVGDPWLPLYGPPRKSARANEELETK
jgi:hypothetical protein